MSPKMERFNQIKTPEEVKKKSNQKGMLHVTSAKHPYFCDYVRGSGQSLGVNTHLTSTSTHVVTGKNTCFTRLV